MKKSVLYGAGAVSIGLIMLAIFYPWVGVPAIIAAALGIGYFGTRLYNGLKGMG